METRMHRAIFIIGLCQVILVHCYTEKDPLKRITYRPDAPEAVEVIDQTTNTITINITAPHVSIVTKYLVNDSVHSCFVDVNENSSSTIFTTPATLEPGNEYTFRVKSLNQDVGNENFTDVTGYTLPSPPANVTVVDRQTTSVTLLVKPGTGRYGSFWAVYFNMRHPGPVANISERSVVLYLPGLLPGASYNISVFTRANNLRNTGSNFDGMIISTLPSPPSSVIVTARTATSLNLTVNPGQGDHDGFRVVYSGTGVPPQYFNSTTEGSMNLLIGGLQPGTLYNISVFTLANNLQSTEAAFPGSLTSTLPSPPSSVIVTNKTATSLNLTVHPGQGSHDGFRVVCSGAGALSQDFNSTTEGSMDFFIGGLQPGTLYDISVFTLANNLQSSEAVVPEIISLTYSNVSQDIEVIPATPSSILMNVTAGDEAMDDLCSIAGYITGPTIAMEGSTVQCLAIFSVDQNCSSSSFMHEIEWYIGDVDITRKNISKVQIQSNYSQVEMPWSYLTLHAVSTIESRPLRACYIGKCYNKSAIQVQPSPRVRIDPGTVAVEVGGQINLSCIVTEHANVDALEFTWAFSGIVKSKESSLPGIPLTIDDVSILQLQNVTQEHSGNYTCTVMLYTANSTTITRSSTSFLYVLNKDAETCPKTTDNSGLVWTMTPVGHTLTQACPDAFTGFATRVCNKDRIWKKTNLIKCVRKAIDDALMQINGIKEGLVDASEINKLLDSMTHITATSNSGDNELSSGDLSKTSVVLDAMIDVIDESRASPNVTENFVNIIDNMLSPVNHETWTDVNKQSSTTDASTLMKTVEKLGNAVGKNISVDEPITIRGSNIAVEIKRIRNHNIHSRPNISSSHSNFQHEIALNLGAGMTGDVTFTAALYGTIANILPDNGNVSRGYPSEVLALSIINGYPTQGNLPSNVSLKFDTDTLHSDNNLTGTVNINCVFWNFNDTAGAIGWSDVGCTWSTEKKTCLCNHLTNFAVLMSPIEITNDLDIARLRVITLVGCSLSILSTVVTMVVYMLLWRYVKNDRSILVMNLCVAVTAGYVLFLVGLDQTDDNVVCTVIAAFLHFLFLAIFCLMLADGIQLLRRATVVMNVKSILKWLLLIGWGVPAIIVGITVGVKHDGGYHSKKYCWLTLTDGVLYSFVGPVLAVIVVNVIVVILVLKALLTSQFIMTKSQRQRMTSAIRSICVLLPVLGITWLFGILSVNDDLIAFQYLFAVTNSLQGFFIFLFHCVFSVPVRRGMQQKYKKFESTSKSNKSQATSTQSSRYSIDNVIDYPHRTERFDKLSVSNASLHSTQSSHLKRTTEKSSPL